MGSASFPNGGSCKSAHLCLDQSTRILDLPSSNRLLEDVMLSLLLGKWTVGPCKEVQVDEFGMWSSWSRLSRASEGGSTVSAGMRTRHMCGTGAVTRCKHAGRSSASEAFSSGDLGPQRCGHVARDPSSAGWVLEACWGLLRQGCYLVPLEVGWVRAVSEAMRTEPGRT